MSAPPHVGRSSRVLVARLDSLGDVLLAGPAVRAVARCADVTMLVRSGLAKAAELLPGVDDVVEFDAAWVLFDPPPIHRDAIADLLEAVEARHFHAALVLTSLVLALCSPAAVAICSIAAETCCD